MAEFTVNEIVPGVSYVSGGVCNRGIIADGGDVLVIDSGINDTEGQQIREAANTQHQSGTLVLFNTHPHLDHFGGNQAFKDATIIAHQGTRDSIVQNGEQMLAMFRARSPQIAEQLSNLILTPPTDTFTEQQTIHVGKIEVQLLYFGINHSPSDSVAWLPESRTLFTGDLLFNAIVPVTPPGASIATWIETLKKLEQLGAEHIISGHGPLQPPTALSELRTWFETLRAQVSAAISDGLGREATIARVTTEIEKVGQRAMSERLPMVIGLAYDEISK